MRLAAFIISLLLLDGTVDPTRGWLIALVVVTGLAATRLHHGNLHPAIDLRLASFVLAVLLLAGTIDPTKDWFIGLSIVTGLAMVAPHALSIDLFGFNERAGRRRHWDWSPDWFSWSFDDDDWFSRRSIRREQRRMARSSRDWRAGDDWP